MTNYPAKIAEFVINNRDWIKATQTEQDRIAYDFLQDNFSLNTFRGKAETIAAKIQDWYPVEEDRPWYGVVSRVFFRPGGALDPSLMYSGYEFNYWDTEEATIDMYRDDLRELYPDEEYLNTINYEVGGDPHDDNWIDWLRDNADRVRGYLDELIASGIPRSWRDWRY